MSFDPAALLSWISRLLQIAVVLGGIILVHEFGHYITAKWSRMRVEEFAIGVGPTLASWQRGGTLYRLCPFLFMGYVRIRGLEGEADADQSEGSFYTRPHYQRAVVILGGAAMNVITAALLFCLLYGLWGIPDQRATTRLADVVAGSPAAQAGVEKGSRIVAVDGQPVSQPKEVERLVTSGQGRPLRLTLEHRGAVREVTVTPRLDPEAGKPRVGVVFEDDGGFTPVVGKLEPNGPADLAGLRRGDRLTAVNGQPLDNAARILEALMTVPKPLELQAPDQVMLPPVRVTYERAGQVAEATLQPKPRREQRPKPNEDGSAADPAERPIESYLVADTGLVLQRRYKRLGLGEAVKHGFQNGWDTVMAVFQGFGMLARGRVDMVGGPVLIVKELRKAAFLGWYELLNWAGVLSIMIGVFNLLPLPALDGGRLVFIVWEWVLGSPLLDRKRETWVHAVGMIVLLSLMVLVSLRDLQRW